MSIGTKLSNSVKHSAAFTGHSNTILIMDLDTIYLLRFVKMCLNGVTPKYTYTTKGVVLLIHCKHSVGFVLCSLMNTTLVDN